MRLSEISGLGQAELPGKVSIPSMWAPAPGKYRLGSRVTYAAKIYECLLTNPNDYCNRAVPPNAPEAANSWKLVIGGVPSNGVPLPERYWTPDERNYVAGTRVVYDSDIWECADPAKCGVAGSHPARPDSGWTRITAGSWYIQPVPVAAPVAAPAPVTPAAAFVATPSAWSSAAGKYSKGSRVFYSGNIYECLVTDNSSPTGYCNSPGVPPTAPAFIDKVWKLVGPAPANSMPLPERAWSPNDSNFAQYTLVTHEGAAYRCMQPASCNVKGRPPTMAGSGWEKVTTGSHLVTYSPPLTAPPEPPPVVSVAPSTVKVAPVTAVIPSAQAPVLPTAVPTITPSVFNVATAPIASSSAMPVLPSAQPVTSPTSLKVGLTTPTPFTSATPSAGAAASASAGTSASTGSSEGGMNWWLLAAATGAGALLGGRTGALIGGAAGFLFARKG